MNKFLLTLSFVSAVGLCSAHSVGSLEIEDQTVESIDHQGSVALDDVVITGDTIIIGELEAADSTLNVVKVEGNTKLTGAVVRGRIRVDGELDAEHSVFLGPLIVVDNDVVLDDCVTTDIRIRGNQGTSQTLTLEGGTVVTGNISFEAGNGVVKSKHAHITGQIIGGKIK